MPTAMLQCGGECGALMSAGAEVPALRPLAPALGGLRILVVDDNRDLAELMADVLETLGHDVVVAHDGPSALRLMEQADAPTVALLDIGLPVMDGYELARRLRGDPRLVGIRLVAVTGHGLDSDRERSRAAGFDAHLLKPMAIAALEAAITPSDN